MAVVQQQMAEEEGPHEHHRRGRAGTHEEAPPGEEDHRHGEDREVAEALRGEVAALAAALAEEQAANEVRARREALLAAQAEGLTAQFERLDDELRRCQREKAEAEARARESAAWAAARSERREGSERKFFLTFFGLKWGPENMIPPPFLRRWGGKLSPYIRGNRKPCDVDLAEIRAFGSTAAEKLPR